jgi:hypothetical protein
MVLVIDEATFRSLAVHDMVDGREYLTAAFEMHSGGTSRWAPHLVARDRLAERLGAAASLPGAGEPSQAGAVDRGRQGFLGEAEVIRRLAESEALALFRPFPDLETVEVLVQHRASGGFAGLQVKTSGWDAANLEERVYFRRSSFRGAPTTWVCVLGWDREAGRFAEDCLLVPSGDVAGLARVEGDWLVLELQPGSARHRRLDDYRVALAGLARRVEALFVPPVRPSR